ncbi:MAG: hypothetical protein NTW74_21210 [Acidobacteria bacterium]|nr:hypothetical protein [Acidobacteriota bacterium]
MISTPHQHLVVAAICGALWSYHATRYFLEIQKPLLAVVLLVAMLVAFPGFVAQKNWARRLMLAVTLVWASTGSYVALLGPSMGSIISAAAALFVCVWMLLPEGRALFIQRARNWGFPRAVVGMLLLTGKIAAWWKTGETESVTVLLTNIVTICFAYWMIWSGVRRDWK